VREYIHLCVSRLLLNATTLSKRADASYTVASEVSTLNLIGPLVLNGTATFALPGEAPAVIPIIGELLSLITFFSSLLLSLSSFFHFLFSLVIRERERTLGGVSEKQVINRDAKSLRENKERTRV